MAKNPPDERLVYLSCRAIFKEADALVRQPKVIRKLLQKNGRFIEALSREHNFDTICNVTKELLEDRVFESTLQAKIRFPELFEISEARSAERAVSEAEAARSEANAVKEVLCVEEDGAVGQEEDTGAGQDGVISAPAHQVNGVAVESGQSGKRKKTEPRCKDVSVS